MNENLLKERNSNKQNQEVLIRNLERKTDQLDVSLASHETLQDSILGRMNVPAGAQVELNNSANNLFRTYDETYDERSRLDKNDPEFITKDLDIVKERCKAQVQYSREKDLTIQKVANKPVTSLEQDWENREDKYREFKQAAQVVKDNVIEGVELDELIEKSESDHNKKSGSMGTNNQSPISSDQISNSLIDDFANPNLEQPSYMDPED